MDRHFYGHTIVWCALFCFSPSLIGASLNRSTSDEVIIAFKGKPFAIKGIKIEEKLFGQVYAARLTQRNSLEKTLEKLKGRAGIKWAAPNYIYRGDPRESTPNDPQVYKQHHHKLIGSFDAWDLTPGNNSIIVAVTDDGVSINHEDLSKAIWTNKKEIPANGIDDDGNGYIDDVHGWDFTVEKPDPNPAEYDDHGTHVSGIVAATSNNGVGVSGTAPGVQVMPLKFYSWGVDWTSKIIAKTYAYAVDNGAKIITTSYNIDGFVDDPTFTEAVKYVYGKGALHFNSAGNGNEKNPPRQKIEELLLVCNTRSENTIDKINESSNYGTGIDLCAPGTDILSTIPANKYESYTGTSMASPNAAAVAALIWSLHPNWTRDQIAAQLLGSCENIESKNAAQFAGLLGAGRVDSWRSLSKSLPAPRLGGVNVTADTVEVRTLSVFDANSMLDKSHWELRNLNTGDKVLFNLPDQYRVGTNLFVLRPNTRLTPGSYQLKVTGLTDPFGQALESGSFIQKFEVAQR